MNPAEELIAKAKEIFESKPASTETVELTPETVTIADIRKWDAPTMRKYMASPLRDRIFELIAEAQTPAPEPTPEPVKTQEQLQQEQEAARKAAADAEAARLAAVEAAKPKKLVVEYQIRDEEGNPIGRPTHLEALTQDELIEKMKEAHTQATRAFHRLKKQKISLREPEPQQPRQVGMTDAELAQAIKDAKSDDPVKAVDAQKRIAKSEFDRNLDPLRKENEQLRGMLRAQEVSRQFLQLHKNDFNNCEANVKLISGYIQDNGLDWTLDNLEIAFLAKESELAPVDRVPVTPVVPANPVTTPASTPSTAAAPVVSATPVTPAPAQAVNQPRPGVNGGIEPGSTSTSRPSQTTPTRRFTMAEIRKWSAQVMREHLARPADRAEIDAVVADYNAQKAAAAASR